MARNFFKNNKKYVGTIFCFVIVVQFFNSYSTPQILEPENVLRAHRSAEAEPKIKISRDCVCTDSSGIEHDFCYRLPANNSVIGQRFDCKLTKYLEKLGLLNVNHIDLSRDEMPPPTFITAFSDNHAHEGRRQLKLIRQYWPQQKVVLYDLGLTDLNRQFFEKACNVEVRQFHFDDYPDYFKQLSTYRWKPVIIAKSLIEFGSIFYMDSSVTFKKADLNHVYDLVRCKKNITDSRPALPSIEVRDKREAERIHEDGWNVDHWKESLKECRKSSYMFHGYTGHGIYSVTHPDVYRYIPTDVNEIKKPKAKMYEAGFVFALRTEETMEKIMKWYVLCALEEGCMAPRGSDLGCSFGKDRFADYANCHRYDQSIANLLAANGYWYDRHYYVSEIVDFFNVVRYADPRVTENDVLCEKIV